MDCSVQILLLRSWLSVQLIKPNFERAAAYAANYARAQNSSITYQWN